MFQISTSTTLNLASASTHSWFAFAILCSSLPVVRFSFLWMCHDVLQSNEPDGPIDFFLAYNGSLISSLTRPELSKPLETFKDLLEHADQLDIITMKNSAAQQYMSTTSNEYLRKLLEISEATGWSNATDVEAIIDVVVQSPNKVCFNDLSGFLLLIQPPSQDGLR